MTSGTSRPETTERVHRYLVHLNLTPPRPEEYRYLRIAARPAQSDLAPASRAAPSRL
ncbi:MAG TPA: hypothetical protein VKV40_00305 [Ktedonobacteraceae bacterium]|nr:hypothetical protein [Ktedonobacteraceae bacterium]